MTSATPAEAMALISRYEARIKHLKEIEIPGARESARQSRAIGRYARAADYMRLLWDCDAEASSLERAVAQLEALFTREELCHSPEAP